jgi:hypothetical protein
VSSMDTRSSARATNPWQLPLQLIAGVCHEARMNITPMCLQIDSCRKRIFMSDLMESTVHRTHGNVRPGRTPSGGCFAGDLYRRLCQLLFKW